MAIDVANPEPFEPADAVTRVAGHLRRLIHAATSRSGDHDELEAAVRGARDAGEPWDLISQALGISPEEARARYDAR